MSIDTLEDAQYEMWAMRKDAEADGMEADETDIVVAACFALTSDSIALELCMTELGYVPLELRERLGNYERISLK